MIDYVKGQVVHWEAEYIVIDVRDIGYRVFTPNPYEFAAGNGDAVTVYTHHHVREDAVLLYGFASREQQRLFRKLLEVSGIGPRVALGILAGGRPEAVIAAIQQENLVYLTKLPGIGRKTAQRMILDLKDKLDADAMPHGTSSVLGTEPEGTTAGAEEQGSAEAWKEAREALSALGYSQAELDRAWHAIRETTPADDTVDLLMKRALQSLFKG